MAAFAVGAEEAFVCLKASFEREIAALTRAVQEFQAAGICTDCTVNVVAGPDEYLFGEEKAMLEVIEGKPRLPRWFAPYEHGLFAAGPQEGREAGSSSGRPRSDGPNPTLVNNVATLANVPHVLARGADWSRSTGTPESPGTVVAPDVGEFELGTPLGVVIDAAYRLSRLLYPESCGQCPPCKIGSGEITTRLEHIETGGGTEDDIAAIHGWLERVTDGNRSCPRPGERPIAKLIDLADSSATYDEHFWHERPTGPTVPSDRHGHVAVRRVYDADLATSGGYRVLVDRLWPRGISKDDAAVDEWLKDAAPSTELRRWYGHEIARFDEFARRYRAELSRPPASAAVEHLAAIAKRKHLTLVTATRDVAHSGAAVLEQHLDHMAKAEHR